MKIRIRQYEFTLAEPFSAGHPLTVSEAQALNALRAENIRNNMSKRVYEQIALLPDGELLAGETVVMLQNEIDAYASRYQFPFRHQNGLRTGLVEGEALRIARDEVLSERERLGEPMSGPVVEAEIELLAATSDMIARARQEVEARDRIAKQGLEELL